MDPIAVDIRLIRVLLGADLRLAPGRALMARVVSTDGLGRGSLSIAGALIEAGLPKGVEAGQDLRLVVRHISPEQVVLGMSEQAGAAAASSSPAVELPGGGRFHVTERDASEPSGGDGGTGRHTLALVYDAPALGAIDLRFELDPQSLRVNATLAAGGPAERATDAAAELREALSEALGGRPVTVQIMPRREPLDVYA